MSLELTILVLAALLQFVQFALLSIPANLQLGPGKLASPRDPERLGKPLEDQLSPVVGRLFRAFNNHFEALILFAIAVLALEFSGKSSALTEWLAMLYLGARVLYIPAYALGLAPWRSLIWFIGQIGTIGILISTLL